GITLAYPNGQTEAIPLSGPTVVQVMIGPGGLASDTDGNGLHDVATIMTQLNLNGLCSMGPVQVTLDPAHPTVGKIEEQYNNTPGILDIPPFTAAGSATSFFDVFVDITLDRQIVYPATPLHLQTLITHNPPA